MKSIPLILLALFGAALMTASPAIAEDAPLKLANTNITDVLAEYGRLIGKTVIADPTVQGRISVVTDAPVSREQAAALIEKALFLYDFTLIDAGDDTVKALGLGKLTRTQAPPVYTKPEEIPNHERVFSYLYRLQHHEVVSMASYLQQVFPPTNIGSITMDVPSRTLLITAPTSVVRRAIQLLDALDVPGAEGKPAAAKNADASLPSAKPDSAAPSSPKRVVADEKKDE